MVSTLEETLTPGPASPPSRPGVSLTDILLLTTATIWGFNYVVVKYGTDVMAPLAYNGVRVAFGAVVLAVLVLLRPHERVSRRDVLTLLGLGVLGNCAYQLLFIEGVARTRAGTAALVLAAAPAFIALMGRALGIERINRKGVAGIALSLAGIALVTFGRGAARGGATGAAGGSTLAGNLLMLAGTVCWSLFTVLLQPYTHRMSLAMISAITMIGGAVPLVALSLPSITATDWERIGPLTWAAIAYSGALSLGVAYLFWYRGVRVLGPTRTAISSNLQPVIALLVAWPLLHEVPTLWQGAGAATIIAGVLLTRS